MNNCSNRFSDFFSFLVTTQRRIKREELWNEQRCHLLRRETSDSISRSYMWQRCSFPHASFAVDTTRMNIVQNHCLLHPAYRPTKPITKTKLSTVAKLQDGTLRILIDIHRRCRETH